jgi:hypothetical protein
VQYVSKIYKYYAAYTLLKRKALAAEKAKSDGQRVVTESAPLAGFIMFSGDTK